MSGRHNLELRSPGSNDKMLDSRKIRKGDRFMDTVSETYHYDCEEGYIITAVLAEDQWSDDTGGNAELVSGGPGKKHVTIKVTSRWNRGFHFRFIVYGKRVSAPSDSSGQTSGGGIKSSDNWQYKILYRKSDEIIRALSANGLTERLAGLLKGQKMIGEAVYDRATNYAPNVTEYTRMKHLITAVQTSTRATPQRYHDFIKVLKSHSIRADAEAALVLLPTHE